MRFSILTVSAALVLSAMTFDAAEAQDALKPVQHWGGLVKESGKKPAAPKAGYLSNKDAFEKRWDAWGLKDKAPKIDFKKQIVLVQTCEGPNLPRAFYALDAAGKLTAQAKCTEKGGPGFGYSIDVLDRTGIKSYQGKPLE
jgi:hypothetical protein